MWERIFNFGRLLFNLGEDLKANRDNTERLEQEVRDLTTVVRQLAFELQRTRENQTHELEKIRIASQVRVASISKASTFRDGNARKLIAPYQPRQNKALHPAARLCSLHSLRV